MKTIPIILDTDIGTDIDDSWALAMLLKSPEFDIKLVVSDTHNTEYRAKLIARFLETADRTDIPVGVGIKLDDIDEDCPRYAQYDWIKDYSLKDYPGKVYDDGVDAIINTIMQSDEIITLVCIGPMPNIAEALRREPKIAEKTRFVGMHGAFNWRWNGVPEPGETVPEYNVEIDIQGAQKVFSAKWINPIITPLDTCALVVLDGELYQKVINSDDKLMQAVIENYKIWAKHNSSHKPAERSSILFDTVAIHLAYTNEFLQIDNVNMKVDDKGYTRIDDASLPIDVAMKWKDLSAYNEYLVGRLLSPVVRKN